MKKFHLLIKAGRTACGLEEVSHTTKDPAKVTCGGCQRTLAMADAEVAVTRRRKIRPVQ
jgi:hypothetical protein